MANIGLRGIKMAILDEATNEYSGGVTIGKAIKADIQISSNDVKLYAEDAVAESDQSFKSGKITIGVDDISTENQGLALGHQVSEEGELISRADDIAPYMGVGFYAVKKKNNKLKYRAIVFLKVQFSEPNDTSETKGETVSFQTPSIEGSILVNKNREWKKEKTFETEEEAIEYINEKLNIETE